MKTKNDCNVFLILTFATIQQAFCLIIGRSMQTAKYPHDLKGLNKVLKDYN